MNEPMGRLGSFRPHDAAPASAIAVIASCCPTTREFFFEAQKLFGLHHLFTGIPVQRETTSGYVFGIDFFLDKSLLALHRRWRLPFSGFRPHVHNRLRVRRCSASKCSCSMSILFCCMRFMGRVRPSIWRNILFFLAQLGDVAFDFAHFLVALALDGLAFDFFWLCAGLCRREPAAPSRFPVSA